MTRLGSIKKWGFATRFADSIITRNPVPLSAKLAWGRQFLAPPPDHGLPRPALTDLRATQRGRPRSTNHVSGVALVLLRLRVQIFDDQKLGLAGAALLGTCSGDPKRP